VQGQELLTIFKLRVRSRRRELGLTQKQVADRIGVTQAYVATIEAGRNAPGLDVIAKFAEALNTTPSALLSGEEIFSQTSA